MPEPAMKTNPKLLATQVCRNEHLESIFLDYLRYCATKRNLGEILQNEENIQALDFLIDASLALFLNEACKRLPIEQLNGQKQEFLEETSQMINKKYRLEFYF